MIECPKNEEEHLNDQILESLTLSKGFYIGSTVVTQSQWYRVMETRPWDGEDWVGKGDDYPAVFISWDDCQKFIKRLNSIEKTHKFRLPTEEEWEYSCRAGSQTQFCFGDNEETLKDYAWFINNTIDIGEEFAHPVAQKFPNNWGLYDMHGNIRELCNTYIEIKKGTFKYYIYRGGAWNDPAEFCRSSTKFRAIPKNRKGNCIGFRLVKTLYSL